MKRGRGLLGVIALAAGIVSAAAATREVYVWQRQFGPEVAASLRRLQPEIDGCCVLAAEVSWTAGQPRVVRPALDYAALKALRKPVGLALRIGAFPGPFLRDDTTARALGDVAADLLARARESGLPVAELQIDFDAAEAKLAGYREWLLALRSRVDRVPLAFTALPVWLKHDTFPALARAADRFILQVHALEKPADANAAFALCDSAKAIAWARQAGEIGVPFRVALPTYGYVVAFSAAGKFLGLAAEGPRPAWPADAVVRVVRADAQEMARLARELAENPPSSCTGVIWFRLPVATDRLNWDPATLVSVLRGEKLVVRFEVEVAWPEPGLAELHIVNHGATTEPPPARIAVEWSEKERLLAGDALSGFRLDARGVPGQATIIASAVPPDALIAPGRRMKIAWLRFSHELSLDARPAASLSPP